MKKTKLKRCVAAVVLAATLMTTQVAVSAEVTPIEPGTHTSRRVIVDERDTEMPDAFCAVSTGQSQDSLNHWDWDDNGVHGQAVRFNGFGDYMEYSSPSYFSDEVTVMGWVYWCGSASNNPEEEFDQQLFTLLRERPDLKKDSDEYVPVDYCTVIARHQMEESTGRCDGVYVKYRIGGNTGITKPDYRSVPEGIDNAIPKNQWTHVAMTLGKHGIKVYINGREWLNVPRENACYELQAEKLVVGGWMSKVDLLSDERALGKEEQKELTPTFNGMMDDVALFQGVFKPGDIGYMAAGASLYFDPPEEKTTPSAETSSGGDGSESAPANPEEDALHDVDNSSAFSDITIPTFTWFVVGGLVLLMIIGTILLNHHEAKRKKGG